ncbi:acyltransferase [Massilia sp. R2A-15]|uniref:acyltransferase family protein n=1 Tax=Massilia sp. R2A-15 TaxID=3064278 RepID=UPI002733D0A9|nr:acyltransferase [Massilia sp. R2A-15]WLI90663.1 acyltransferase [Massilia sp. R2A-15]
MRKHIPKLTFQAHSQSGDDCWHSVLIAVLRGLAAIEVAAAHLRAEVYPGLREVAGPPLWFQGLAFITGFAHHAVLVFFVISGWLVGGSLLDKFRQPAAIAGYAIDRVTRLWTVLIPTFVLTLLLGVGTGVVSASRIDFSPSNSYSALAFAGNLFGLQTVSVPVFGDNLALWSLANETWYYLMFPLLVAAFWAHRLAARFACGATVIALAGLLPGPLVGYFAVWLLGVAFSRIRIECGAGVRACWLVLAAALWVYYRLAWNMDAFDFANLAPDLVCSVVFLVFMSSLQFQASASSTLRRPLAKIGGFFADFSFSLYVLHLPLIGLLQQWLWTALGLRTLSPHQPLHLAIYLGMLATLLAASYLSYRLFESQTYRLRRLAKRILLQGRARTAPPSAVGAD